MSSSLERARGRLPRKALSEVGQEELSIAVATHLQQLRQQAIASASGAAMFEVMSIKRLQHELGSVCPDAAESLALIANTASLAIARSVQQFSFGIG